MTNLVSFARQFGAVTRQDGLWKALDLIGAHVLIKERRKMESRFGLDTEKPVLLDDLTIEGTRREEGFYYGATPPRVIHALLANIPDVEDFVFVDFGSGKGLVLLVAAEYEFKSIVGVEFAHELHEIALQNIAKYRIPKPACTSIRSICADATEYPIPPDNCVLYFCNPFTDSVMQDVINNIGQSIQDNNQKVYVLFHQLVDEEDVSLANPIPLFESASFLVERDVQYRSAYEQFLLKHLRLKIYESNTGNLETPGI